jgi:hypothetical protein
MSGFNRIHSAQRPTMLTDSVVLFLRHPGKCQDKLHPLPFKSLPLHPTTGRHRPTVWATESVVKGTINKREVIPRTFLCYDTNRIENHVSKNSSIVARVFVAARTRLPTRYLRTKLFPINNRGIHIRTYRQQGELISPILLFFSQNKKSGLKIGARGG